MGGLFRDVQGYLGFLGGSVVKTLPVNAGVCRRHGFDPWVRKIPWRRKWQPTPVFLSGESHGFWQEPGRFGVTKSRT